MRVAVQVLLTALWYLSTCDWFVVRADDIDNSATSANVLRNVLETAFTETTAPYSNGTGAHARQEKEDKEAENPFLKRDGKFKKLPANQRQKVDKKRPKSKDVEDDHEVGSALGLDDDVAKAVRDAVNEVVGVENKADKDEKIAAAPTAQPMPLRQTREMNTASFGDGEVPRGSVEVWCTALNITPHPD